MAVSRPRYLDRPLPTVEVFSNGQSFVGVYLKNKRAEYEKAIAEAKEELGANYEHERWRLQYLATLQRHAAAERASYRRGAKGGSYTAAQKAYNSARSQETTLNLKVAQKAGEWTNLSERMKTHLNNEARSKIDEVVSGFDPGSEKQVLETIRTRLVNDHEFIAELENSMPLDAADPGLQQLLVAKTLADIITAEGEAAGLQFNQDDLARVVGQVAKVQEDPERWTALIANARVDADQMHNKLITEGVVDFSNEIRKAITLDNGGVDPFIAIEGLKGSVSQSELGQLPEVKAAIAPNQGTIQDRPADTAAEWATLIQDAYELTPEFAQKIVDVAISVGASPGDLANLMYYETGGDQAAKKGEAFSPSVRNAIGATGLIQFTIPTARDALQTTTDELAAMSQVEQMDFVEKYLKQTNMDLSTPEGLAASVFYPRSGGDPNFNIYQDYIARGLPKTAEKFKKQNNGIETLGDYNDRLMRQSRIPSGSPIDPFAEQAAPAQAAQAAPAAQAQAAPGVSADPGYYEGGDWEDLAGEAQGLAPPSREAIQERAREIFSPEDTMLQRIQQRRGDRLGRKALRHMENLPRPQKLLYESSRRAQHFLDSDVDDFVSSDMERDHGNTLANSMIAGDLSMDELLDRAQELAGAIADKPAEVRAARDRILDVAMRTSLAHYRGHQVDRPKVSLEMGEEHITAEPVEQAKEPIVFEDIPIEGTLPEATNG
jgi:hypothetical protein